MDDEPSVHLVDDEVAVRDALSFLLRSHGISVHAYASGPELLTAMSQHALRGCIVLDVRMEPLSGLQVHDLLLARGSTLPVLFLSGHGDIPMAVDALQKGATDFLEKPFSGDALVQKIQQAMSAEVASHAAHTELILEKKRMESLTEREYAVLRMVASGKLNKVIADALCVSVRTVEVHRSRGFEKLGVRSSAELATLLTRVDPER